MKITGLKSTIVSVPYTEPEPWAWGIGHYGVNAVVVEVSTDEGIVGVGEGTSPHASAQYSQIILDSATKFIVEEDPSDIERIMRKVWAAGLIDHRVVCAIEMALWDIIGKSCNKAVHALLGGAIAKKIPFAPYINRKKPEEMAEQAITFIRQGFDTFNIKVGIDDEQDIEAVRAVDEATGNRCKIRVDANLAWTPGQAIRMIKRLEKFNLEFVEDPTYIEGMPRVRNAVDTPISSGAETLHEIYRTVKAGAADIIGHIDPKMQGGILNSKKACAICEAAGLPVVGHAGWELSIATHAVLHIAASTPNFILPNQTYYMYLADDICKHGPLTFEDGCMNVPEKPGLGIELDRNKVSKYAENFKSHGGFSIYDRAKKEKRKILPYPIY
jgi:L-alanine-DL-glutamate epimerase-like enolase superfamily enzyme